MMQAMPAELAGWRSRAAAAVASGAQQPSRPGCKQPPCTGAAAWSCTAGGLRVEGIGISCRAGDPGMRSSPATLAGRGDGPMTLGLNLAARLGIRFSMSGQSGTLTAASALRRPKPARRKHGNARQRKLPSRSHAVASECGANLPRSAPPAPCAGICDAAPHTEQSHRSCVRLWKVTCVSAGLPLATLSALVVLILYRILRPDPTLQVHEQSRARKWPLLHHRLACGCRLPSAHAQG